MQSEAHSDSRLETIMQKFRPIAPKPPVEPGRLAVEPDRTGPGPMMKRIKKVEKKPRRITAPPPRTARVTVVRVTSSAAVRFSGEADVSPCFVSDCADRVTWINAAFRRMVLCEESGEGLVRVELATRGMVPGGECGGFTCLARVRVGDVTMAVPCDVWRVVGGGKWAWRLDVATALGLGPSPK